MGECFWFPFLLLLGCLCALTASVVHRTRGTNQHDAIPCVRSRGKLSTLGSQLPFMRPPLIGLYRKYPYAAKYARNPRQPSTMPTGPIHLFVCLSSSN